VAETVRDLRREQIIAAARQLVAEKGLGGLTIAALERRLPFSRGVITYHFKNKDDIIYAVLESTVAEIDAATLAAVEACSTPAEQVGAVMRANARGFVQHLAAVRILMSFWSRIPSDKRARTVNARLYATYRRRASRLVERAKAEGVFAPDVNPEVVASLLVALVLGIAAQEYFEPGAINSAAVLEEATRIVLARLCQPSP